ncbi:hypothetical protein AB3X91_07535 [Paraburkholderia sp. BR14263]|uniref:hypothetical protein n=1 Tax=unclassified Paraburkholderia TaxID=2615204 RepID=UPI0034CE240E
MTELQMGRGDELLLVIMGYADLEWQKCRHRIVDVVMKNGEAIHEDHSRLPPFTTIRFRTENPETVSRLKAAIEGYSGLVPWHMFGQERLTLPGKNWVIRPSFVDELKSEAEENGARDVAHYIGDRYPDLSQKAYVDLLGLAKHVQLKLLGNI